MADTDFAAIKVRLAGDNRVEVTFPENVAEDMRAVMSGDEIPPQYIAAIMARAAVAKSSVTPLVAGCDEKCSKDCFW